MEAKKLSGARLRNFKGGMSDEAVRLATAMIISNSTAYNKVMNFVESQNPIDEYQFTYFFESVARLVALDEETVREFAARNSGSNCYVRMCKLARAIRNIINDEEAAL